MKHDSPASQPTPDPSTAGDRSSRQRRPSSKSRLYLFRLIALLAPIGLLALANVAFWWKDIGVDTTLVIAMPEARSKDWHILNPDVDAAYWDLGDLNGPDSRPFQLPKPNETLRIVVAGASTVEGFPWNTGLAFSRQIELLLQRQLSGKQVEVLNAGIVGISSNGVLDIVAQAVEADPDVIVVYSGHNEFYGPGGTSSRVGSALTSLRKYRLPQVVLRSLHSNHDPSQGLASLLMEDLAIPLDSDSFERTQRNYRRNLEGMAAVASARQVPIIFCSVACNLSAQSPIHSMSSAGLSVEDAAERDRLLKTAEECLEASQFAAALTASERAEQLDGSYSIAVYRKAQSLAGLGIRDRSAEAYSRARDLDGCRFRSPSSFGRIVEEVAASTGTIFVDIERIFQTESETGVPGRDLFWEHVHLTQKASWIVAESISKTIVQTVMDGKWDPVLVPVPDDRDSEFGVLQLDRLSAIATTSGLLGQHPFRNAPDAHAEVAELERQARLILNSLPAGQREAMERLQISVEEEYNIPTIAQGVYLAHQYEECLAMLEAHRRQRDWSPDRYLILASCLIDLKRQDEALRVIDAGLSNVCSERVEELLELQSWLKRSRPALEPRQVPDHENSQNGNAATRIDPSAFSR